MSRPEKLIDWEKVDKLLIAGCMGTEIAPHFDMHVQTFYNKVLEQYKMCFTEYSALKRQQGNSLLRAKQYEKAMKLDNTMLIWLGKQNLGQKDTIERDASPNDKQLDQTLEISKLQYEKDQLSKELDDIKKSKISDK